jgi:cytochrome c553
MRAAHSFSLAVAVVLGGALASCATDPVHQAEVDALGGEVQGVPQGEYHRAGQPCTVCHGPEGPASTQFTMAGTIFHGPVKTTAPFTAIGVDNAQVTMVDSLNSSFTAFTDCVGNFYVTSAQWNPAFPVLVEVTAGGVTQKMQGHIGRETSCANCHSDPPYYDSPGHIYLAQSDDGYTPPACPVNPVQTEAEP